MTFKFSIITSRVVKDENGPIALNTKSFLKIEIVKFITTALKSILNLLKLQSLVTKCCKLQKI